MSCKLVLNISSKDRSIDWPAVAISVRNCLAEKSRANLERVCIIPADKFMTILPVGNYEGTMCEENLLEDFDILVAIGQNSDAMLRKLAKERGIA